MTTAITINTDDCEIKNSTGRQIPKGQNPIMKGQTHHRRPINHGPRLPQPHPQGHR